MSAKKTWWIAIGWWVVLIMFLILFVMPKPHDHNHDTNHDTNHDNKNHDHGMMISSEFDFISQMIPHHQEAVDTSQMLLEITQNPWLEALATAIIEMQNEEIALMNLRIQQRYPERVNEPVTYMPMMRPMDQGTREEIERFRVQDMIGHHQWAIDMAKKVLSISTIRPEVREFANTIITTQSAEIETLQAILASFK
jgi:uncharacterized protein (DUF305 family)